MRKKSREMDASWALEVMDKAPYITVSMSDANGMPYSVPLSLAVQMRGLFIFIAPQRERNWTYCGQIPSYA